MALDAAEQSKILDDLSGLPKILDAIWDVRLGNVKKYAQTYDSMTDAVADNLASSGLENEQQLTALKKKYYGQFKTALGSKTAARWLQAETTVGTLAMLQLLSQGPLLH